MIPKERLNVCKWRLMSLVWTKGIFLKVKHLAKLLLQSPVGGHEWGSRTISREIFVSTVVVWERNLLVGHVNLKDQIQGGVAVISSDSSKMRKHKKNRGLDVSRGSSATAEQVSIQVLELPEGPRIQEGAINCNEKRPFLCKQGSYLNKAQKSASEIPTHKRTSEALKKQNRPENIVDSIACLFNKKKKNRFNDRRKNNSFERGFES